MPDSDKVIKGLQCIIDGTVRCESCGYSIDKHGYHSCQQECAKDAIALLKEQEAKLVRIDEDSVHCPSCGNELFTYPRQRFCDECGQELKWND